jgi:hypothetical protein
MDELTVMRSFRAQRVKQNPTARAAAWQALEARFEAAATAPAPIATPARGRRLLPRRRRLLAFAGSTAAAAVVAGSILVLDSGPTAQPAAAEILHETAAVAAATDAPAEIPGPGEFFYRQFKRLELQSWIPGGVSMGGGVMTRAGAFKAQMPTMQEWWDAPDGAGRVRQVGGTPQFLTKEEQSRWETAGSHLPPPFDPEYQRKYPLAFGEALEARHGVVDTEHPKLEGFHFPDTSSYPTEPEALRDVVENHRIRGGEVDAPSSKPLDTKGTIAGLFDILVEGISTTPQLRAAAFNALAELPGIKVDTDATDFLGRQGYAIRSIDRKTGGGIEFIFDPGTSEMLAQREFLGDRRRGPYLKGLPAGLTIRETAYLESGVVDSTHETAAEAEGGGPVATTAPTYRR